MAASTSNVSFVWDKLIPAFYSIGASVVIIGALFKITHREGANEMLTVGLITEAIIFAIYALQSFLRPPSDYPWEKVYPELDDNYKGEIRTAPQGMGLTAKMDDMLSSSKLSPDIFDGLKSGIQNLTSTVSKIGDITDASVATNEYAKNVKGASSQIVEMNKSYGTAVTAMNSMADATKDAQEYRSQFQKVTQNMGALNAVYELELQDTNKHLKSMNAFYGNLTSAMQNMTEASRDTQQFKDELSKLTSNLNSLNAVYGSMLSAMKGN